MAVLNNIIIKLGLCRSKGKPPVVSPVPLVYLRDESLEEIAEEATEEYESHRTRLLLFPSLPPSFDPHPSLVVVVVVGGRRDVVHRSQSSTSSWNSHRTVLCLCTFSRFFLIQQQQHSAMQCDAMRCDFISGWENFLLFPPEPFILDPSSGPLLLRNDDTNRSQF